MRDPGDLPKPLVNAMREMRPWITFFVVLGYIFGGLIVVGGARALWEAHGFWENTKAGANLALALVYLLPTLYLSRYRREIGRVVAGGGMLALSNAIVHQKSFWRSTGILTVIMMGLALVGFACVAVLLAFHH